jgi:hypothetical protein
MKNENENVQRLPTAAGFFGWPIRSRLEQQILECNGDIKFK